MAAFENKTIGEVKELIINSVRLKCNQTLKALQKSFLNVIATVFSGVFIVCYKQIGWLFLQLYPDSAYWGEVNVLGIKSRPLVNLGRMIGIGDPKDGSKWRGKITVVITQSGGVLIAGTQLKSTMTGKIYITEEGASLESDIAIEVPVICVEYGEAGNMAVDDTLEFMAPLGNVKKTATVSAVVSDGVDAEAEANYRSRVVQYFRATPLGGALADYRKWGLDVDGVYKVFPYKDLDTATGVLLYVAANVVVSPTRIPPPEMLVKVGEACTYDPETGKATRKPIAAILDPLFNGSYSNVLPITVTRFDVAITGVTNVTVADFVEQVKPLVKNYFLEREPYIRGLSDDNNRLDTISRNNVSSIVTQASIGIKAEFSAVSLYLNGVLKISYTLGQGELCEMGTFTVNGVPS